MFKEIANFASMFRQAREMGGKLQAVQQQLAERRVAGSAGAGLVVVEANGLSEVVAVRIDPQALGAGDPSLLEGLLPAAINDALGKAKALHVEAMQSLAAGLPVPGLQDALRQFASPAETEGK